MAILLRDIRVTPYKQENKQQCHTHCNSCGASLRYKLCEYCGTNYGAIPLVKPKKVVKEPPVPQKPLTFFQKVLITIFGFLFPIVLIHFFNKKSKSSESPDNQQTALLQNN